MPINLDANASVKPLPEVIEAICAYKGQFLNASSVHSLGQSAKAVLDQARSEIRQLLSLSQNDRIVFTSGATEANNAALNPSRPPSGTLDLLCSSVEHSAVLETLRFHQRRGYQLEEFAPDAFEGISIDENLQTFALMAANNETGQIFDIKKAATRIKNIAPRARVHCDAVQAVGKIPVNFSDLGIDTLALSGHKLGALSGTGALIISEYCHLQPWLIGGPQEFSLRAGTENILGIHTLAIACKQARLRIEGKDQAVIKAKQALIEYFRSLGSLVNVNQFGEKQLDNTISLRIPGVKADDMVVAMDLCGVAISAGSACTSGRPSPSHVLLAHGMSAEEAKETIRISIEPTINQEDLQIALNAFKEVVSRMTALRRAA